jgi:hypothetical protein
MNLSTFPRAMNERAEARLCKDVLFRDSHRYRIWILSRRAACLHPPNGAISVEISPSLIPCHIRGLLTRYNATNIVPAKMGRQHKFGIIRETDSFFLGLELENRRHRPNVSRLSALRSLNDEFSEPCRL